MPQLRRYSPTVVRWCQNGDFLRPVFSARRVPHISDMHSKFALRPHHCGSMVDSQSPTTEIRQEKKDTRRRQKLRGKNVMACPILQGGHNNEQVSGTFSFFVFSNENYGNENQTTSFRRKIQTAAQQLKLQSHQSKHCTKFHNLTCCVLLCICLKFKQHATTSSSCVFNRCVQVVNICKKLNFTYYIHLIREATRVKFDFSHFTQAVGSPTFKRHIVHSVQGSNYPSSQDCFSASRTDEVRG